ncbi:hypothetical protein [Embleya hyalina]|uniref:Uncharacterized protein n=1 Tax=Embleya hyalina TaxID=516124 RepID=A0A401YZ22_9ACTN|nr:hypothetical protein [Embleya hyalina]GCD99841.1 hypothetical protein EHYA_07563 [Embleya hyalina]
MRDITDVYVRHVTSSASVQITIVYDDALHTPLYLSHQAASGELVELNLAAADVQPLLRMLTAAAVYTHGDA